MAVTKVIEQKPGEARVERGETRASRVFQVWFDTHTKDCPLDALAATDGATSIPATGTQWAGRNLWALSKNASYLEGSAGPYVYVVTVEYTTAKTAAVNCAENPLARAWSISIRGQEKSEEYFYDATGKAVTNLAGEPFDAMPTRMAGDYEICITKNEANFDFYANADYNYVVNSDNFFILSQEFSAGYVLMRTIEANRQEENGIAYWQVTYPMAIRKGGWKDKVLNIGYKEKVGGKLMPIFREGLAVTKPWPLDQNGAALSDPTTQNWWQLTFQPYVEKTFSVFDFVG